MDDNSNFALSVKFANKRSSVSIISGGEGFSHRVGIPPPEEMKFKPYTNNIGVQYLDSSDKYIDNKTTNCVLNNKLDLIGNWFSLKKCTIIKSYIAKGTVAGKLISINLNIFWYEMIHND